jgi:hypothetical protein
MLDIETSPPGAAISIDSEYIGRSPIAFNVKGIDREHDSLRIVAEKTGYQSTAKTVVRNQSTKVFPTTMFLKLDEDIQPAANNNSAPNIIFGGNNNSGSKGGNGYNSNNNNKNSNSNSSLDYAAERAERAERAARAARDAQ